VRGLLSVSLLLLVATPVAAQVDPSGPWRTWHTPHFRLHARAEDSALVAVAAAEAERAYGLLAREIDPPRGSIDLVIADNLDLANGFATVLPSNRITIYAARPTDSPSLSRFDSWERLVITHELTHVFHIDRAGGLWGGLQRVFGRAPGTFPVLYQPTWVTEGTATYYESRFTTAGRLAGSFQRGLLAAAALEGAWPRPGDATPLNPRWPGGGMPYAWGAEFMSLEASRGDSVLPRFIRSSGRQIWPFRVSGPLVNAGGITVANGWHRLYEDQSRRAHQGAKPSTVIASGLRYEPSARVRADGKQLVYVHDDGRSDASVRVLDLASGETIAAHRITAGAEPEWQGDTVYLTQLEFTSPVEVRSDVYRWVPGQSWTRLTRGARLRHPFRAHGEPIGAVAVTPQGLNLRERDGGEWHDLPAPPADAAQRLTLSPNGERFAGALHHDGRWDIAVWSVSDPAHPTWVTDDDALDKDPVFAREGRQLLFASERDGLSQIYVWDAADGTLRRLTDEPTGASNPTPVSDSTIVYVSPRYDGWALIERAYTPGPIEPVAMGARSHFQTAPPAALTSGGFNPWPALRPRFWIPIGHLEGETGAFGGIATAGMDPIGRTTYAAFVGAAIQPLRWEAMLVLQHQRWRRFGIDARISQRWNGLSGGRYGERERKAETGLTWRWRRWRSAARVRLSGDVVRTAFFDDSAAGAPVGTTPILAGGTISVAAGAVSRPGFAISDENGFRIEALARRRWALADTAWSAELRGAASAYLALPLPGFAHWVLAARVAAGRSGGPVGPLYEVGGASGQPLEWVPGLLLGEQRQFALRGYPANGLATRVAVGAVELRVPLALVGRGLWKLPVLVDRLSMSVFGEAGGGWVAGMAAELPYRDVGAELVLDLGFMYDFAVRLRSGIGVPLADGLGVSRGNPRIYVTAGSAF